MTHLMTLLVRIPLPFTVFAAAPCRVYLHRRASGSAARRERAGRDVALRVGRRVPSGCRDSGWGERAGSCGRRSRPFTMGNTDAFRWGERADPLYKAVPFFLAMRHGVAHETCF